MSESQGLPHNEDLIYARNEVPPFRVTLMMAVQIIILMIVPITVTPLVVVRVAGLDPSGSAWVVFASLIASGITSFIQIRKIGKIGSGHLLFMGSSGAFLAVCVMSAKEGGWPLTASLCISSAVFQILFARYLGLFRKIITPMVGGVTVTLIVVAVLPIAVDLMVGKGSDMEVLEDNFWLVVGTLMATILSALYVPAKYRICAPLVGMGAGLVLAWFLDAMDWSAVASAAWVGLPTVGWEGIDLSFSKEFWMLLPSFVLVTLVGAIETVGDAMTIQQVSDRDYRKVDYADVQGALYADGFGNAFAGALGTLPNTTYSNLISLVELTGVASRRIGYWVAGGMVLLAFFPKLSALIIAIPGAIMGAFLFFVLAILFVSGLRLIGSSGFPFESAVIVGISFWFGYMCQSQTFFPGLIPESIKPFLGNGMVSGSLMAVVFSWLYAIKPKKRARFSFQCREDQLHPLHDALTGFAQRIRLTPQETYNLQLAGEELFVYLYQNVKGQKNVKVLVEAERSEVTLELISSGGEISDVDYVAETYALQPAIHLSPEEMGISLLSRIVSKIDHKTVSGVHYITVHLRRRSSK